MHAYTKPTNGQKHEIIHVIVGEAVLTTTHPASPQ